MTRVIVLGAIVAVGGGAFLGAALAYGVALLVGLAICFALGGALAVALLVPEPEPITDLVTLAGPLVRQVAGPEDDAAGEASAAAPDTEPVPTSVIPTAA